MKIVSPLTRALGDAGALASARAQLGDDQAVENAIKELLRSEYVQAEERGNARDLQGQRAIEQSGMGGMGKAIEDVNTTVKDAGGGSWLLGLFASGRSLAEADVRTQYSKGLRSTRMSDEEAAKVMGMSVEQYRANTRPVGYSQQQGMDGARSDAGGAMPTGALSMGGLPGNQTFIGTYLANAFEPTEGEPWRG